MSELSASASPRPNPKPLTAKINSAGYAFPSNPLTPLPFGAEWVRLAFLCARDTHGKRGPQIRRPDPHATLRVSAPQRRKNLPGNPFTPLPFHAKWVRLALLSPEYPMVKTALKFAGRTDPGRVRRNNEDAFHIDADRGIFLVVDGIGGQAAGEKAAEIAVERLRARLERQTGATEQRIREAIAIANNEILKAARANPEWEGMACVLTVAVLENGSAIVGHVGDSRLYQIRRGEIRKITHDHSPVGEREDKGEIGEAEAMRHPRRNEVFRDVGSEEHAPDDANFIEIQRIPFDAESALLLCSDGLSDQVPVGEIRRAVERHAGDPEAAVRELIDAANRAGGKDNVTVVVVEGEQFTAPAAPHAAPRHPATSSPAAPPFSSTVSRWRVAAAWFARPYFIPPPVVDPAARAYPPAPARGSTPSPRLSPMRAPATPSKFPPANIASRYI